MAKRRSNKSKGKSKRRVKSWHSQYQQGYDPEIRHGSREKLSNRGVKLGGSSFSTGDAEELQDMELATGMITGVFRRGTFVQTDEEVLYCGIAKTFRPPEEFAHTSPLAIGDRVTVALVKQQHVSGDKKLDRNQMDGMILSREPRKTVLARPQPRSAKRNDPYNNEPVPEKVIAANMDTLLIVSAVSHPPMRLELINRFLIAAERGELKPILAVNKIDLGQPDEHIVTDLIRRGVTIAFCSAETGEGLEELQELLRNRRSVLAGASGVGKSTLVNAIIPQADAATRTVRMKDQRGRHTTSQSRIYDVPGGGLLIDTPGVRELGVAIPPDQLPWYFPEFEAFAHDCKFRNCSHTHEPDCAIIAAVEEEKIPAHRYESYRRLRDSIEP